MLSKVEILGLACIIQFMCIHCVPKYDSGNFVPSPLDYIDKSSKAQDQIAMPSDTQEKRDVTILQPKIATINSNDINDRNQEPRFGFTNVGASTGYGVSTYGPGKIDLGGLIVGAVLGVGTILIIPKLLYILSGSYGSYARSEDSGYAQMLTKLDDSLARHGIDTTSCMQRMVCSYTQQAAQAVRSAESLADDDSVSSMDKIIDNISTNDILHAALQGTAIQEAMQTGRSGQNCARVYHHCIFSMETMLSLFTNVLASLAVNNVTRPNNPTNVTYSNAI